MITPVFYLGLSFSFKYRRIIMEDHRQKGSTRRSSDRRDEHRRLSHRRKNNVSVEEDKRSTVDQRQYYQRKEVVECINNFFQKIFSIECFIFCYLVRLPVLEMLQCFMNRRSLYRKTQGSIPISTLIT